MVAVIGFDVGGANTKAALICTKKRVLQKSEVASTYFPFWKTRRSLVKVLLQLKRQLGECKLDALGVTMTAELSDAYQTKREGVAQILGCIKQAFSENTVYVLTTDVTLITMNEAIQNPLQVAAANWAATGYLVSQTLPTCVVVDVGSTSTSIIPIVNRRVVALGKTDLEKLICGELVYTGSLRTNVAAIVQTVPIRSGIASVSSELFATSGDVHLVLGNISQHDFSTETADGRGKTLPEAFARLARVICADTEMLKRGEILDMANFIASKQIQQVAAGLSKVYSYTRSLAKSTVPIVVTGFGKDFIARKAAETIVADEILDLGALLMEKAALATPALGVARMVADKIEGGTVK